MRKKQKRVAMPAEGFAARLTDVGTSAVTVLSMSALGILTTVDAAEIVASFLAVDIAPRGPAPVTGAPQSVALITTDGVPI